MGGRSTVSAGKRSAAPLHTASTSTTSVSTGRWRPWSSSVPMGTIGTRPSPAARATSGHVSFPNSRGSVHTLHLLVSFVFRLGGQGEAVQEGYRLAHVRPQTGDGGVLVGGVRPARVPRAAGREGDPKDLLEEVERRPPGGRRPHLRRRAHVALGLDHGTRDRRVRGRPGRRTELHPLHHHFGS